MQYATKLIIAQARASLAALDAHRGSSRRQALEGIGIGDDFASRLQGATTDLIDAKAQQERLQVDAEVAYDELSEEAERGYRYLQGFWARLHVLEAQGDVDMHDIRRRFVVGDVRRARARGVLFALKVVLPEMADARDLLARVGVDDDYIEHGYAIVEALGAERKESADLVKARMDTTRNVQTAEDAVLQLLHQLAYADEAIALEIPDEGPIFDLKLLHTERRRVEAEREARVMAQPSDLGLDG